MVPEGAMQASSRDNQESYQYVMPMNNNNDQYGKISTKVQ